MTVSQLSSEDYHRAIDLFRGQYFHLAVLGVLNGVIPGDIFVNDVEDPASALMRTGHRFLLVGKPENSDFNEELSDLFARQIFPQGQAAGGEGILIYYEDGWDSAIERSILKGCKLYPGWRQYYTFQEQKIDWRAAMAPGFELVQVDHMLVSRTGLRGLVGLLEEMCSERPSVEAFLQHSFGVTILHGERIVSWCLSEYNQGQRCEVGIATAEEYRRQGLAALIGAAFIDLAHQRGIEEIGWHCWARNVGSVNTALRIGFEKVRDYPACFVPFSQA